MTAPAFPELDREAPGLVAAPDEPRRRRRSRRTLVAAGLALLVGFLVLVGLASGGGSSGGSLDPRSAKPSGTRALAELLRGRDVTVERGTASGPGRTVVVPFVSALSREQLDALLGSGSDVVLVDPGPVTTAQLATDGGLRVQDREPACSYPAATVAGAVRLGGTAYTSTATVDVASCYGGSLLTLPAGALSPGSGRLTVLGDAGFLTNARLDESGNAALALGLLDDQPRLTWYSGRRETGGATITDLLPAAVGWGVLQLGFAVLLVALWRGRRLGPVVTEPLPVVVRAGETVMGRARLYAAARARGSAAEALRTGSRMRLAQLLHLDASTPAQALITAVAERARPDAPTVAGILYGTPPGAAPRTDAELVRLAADLDSLEREVAS